MTDKYTPPHFAEIAIICVLSLIQRGCFESQLLCLVVWEGLACLQVLHSLGFSYFQHLSTSSFVSFDALAPRMIPETKDSSNSRKLPAEGSLMYLHSFS